MSLLRPELSKEHERVLDLNMMLFCEVLSVNLITFGSAVLTRSCNVDHVSNKELVMTWRLIRFQNSSFWRLVRQSWQNSLSWQELEVGVFVIDWPILTRICYVQFWLSHTLLCGFGEISGTSVTYCLSYQQEVKLFLFCQLTVLKIKLRPLKTSAADGIESFKCV